MLAHSFDRFYVVTKFMLPTIGDLKFSKLDFDYTCASIQSLDTTDQRSLSTAYQKNMLQTVNQGNLC